MSNARFSILQARAVSDPKISNAQFRTLAALATFGDKDGWCFPKLQTLGDMVGKSKQAVSMDIKELVSLGYVQIQNQYRPDGSQKNNLYRIVFDLPPLTPPYPPVNASLTGGTDQVNPPLSSEVNPLTTHINAPIETKEEVVVVRPNIFKIYEQEIGVITPFVRDDLLDIEKEYPEGWFEKAIKEARQSTTRISMNYLRSILKRWKTEGLEKPREGKSYTSMTVEEKLNIAFAKIEQEKRDAAKDIEMPF